MLILAKASWTLLKHNQQVSPNVIDLDCESDPKCHGHMTSSGSPMCFCGFVYTLYIRISGYPGIQISGYPDIRVSGYPDIRISGYPDIQTSGYPDTRISGYSDIRIPGYPDIWICEYRGIRVSGYPDIRISGYASIGRSGYADTQISGYSDIQISGCPDTWIAGYPDTRISGYPDIWVCEPEKHIVLMCFSYRENRLKIIQACPTYPVAWVAVLGYLTVFLGGTRASWPSPRLVCEGSVEITVVLYASVSNTPIS